MTIDQLLTVLEDKRPPAPQSLLETLERELGRTLPADYRRFLIACNGGNLGGDYWFNGPTPEGKPADAGISSFGGFRRKIVPNLRDVRDDYGGRIPNTLLWIVDDPFGNAICIGIRGRYFGKVYFWDHEREPDGETWDGSVETAGNIQLLAHSFRQFVAGLKPEDD